MTRQKAIEHAAQVLLDDIGQSVIVNQSYTFALREALAMPEDAEPKRHRWDKDGERCKDCGDKDWTASAVCRPPKAGAERVALVERIDSVFALNGNTDFRLIQAHKALGELRAYLTKGGA